MKPNTQASKAPVWMDCSASALIDISGLPKEKKPFADRGKFLHEVSHYALLNPEGTFPGDLEPDEVDSVKTYVDYVRSKPGLKKYELKGEYAGRNCYVDTMILDGDTLEVIDYKSGRLLVRPVGNFQLVIYAIAVLEKYEVILGGEVKNLLLTIVQPTAEPAVRTWKRTLDELYLERNKVEGVLKNISEGNADFRPSKETCRWCSAKTICPALGKKADPTRLEGATFAEKYAAIDSMELWIKAIKEEAEARFENGDPFPGFKQVEGQGKRYWEDRKKAKKWLEDQGFGETDIFTEPVMVSPHAAEQLIRGKGAKKKKDELKKFVGKNAGKPKIVPDSHPGVPIDKQAEARKDFAGVPKGEK